MNKPKRNELSLQEQELPKAPLAKQTLALGEVEQKLLQSF
jgi:hypothetical protein